MTIPNMSTLWGEVIVDELVKHGVDTVCVAPGSRSTPLVVAFAEHEEVTVFRHLDERSAGFFAVGRAKQTGKVTPVISTSGTAVANFHPAVIEADQSRCPLLVLSADRPSVLHDTGANQTITQDGMFGEAVRWDRTLPEPKADEQSIRALRTFIARSIALCYGSYPGPVHLNIPFSKPLAPVEDAAESIDDQLRDGRTRFARTSSYTTLRFGSASLSNDDMNQLKRVVRTTEKGLIIVGPLPPAHAPITSIVEMARSVPYPVLADPLSGIRFRSGIENCLVCGGYDSYLAEQITRHLEPPELVLQFGANPTSVQLHDYIARTEPRHFLIDPSPGWQESTFTASDLIIADPDSVATNLASIDIEQDSAWLSIFERLETAYWEKVDEVDRFHEGQILATVMDFVPAESVVFVGNSMPIRDLDRFVYPRQKDLSLIGNRGASGIDGNISTALGAGSSSGEQLVAVLGDVAFYHDMNGLLAVNRCDIDITIVVINNDGGGIFHMLPIADFEPPFTSHFKMPHGLQFESAAELYGLSYAQIQSLDTLESKLSESFTTAGSMLIEIDTDAAESHSTRQAIQQAVTTELAATFSS